MPHNEREMKLAKLAALRSAFAAALPERLEIIAYSWRKAETAPSGGEALSELTRLAHSLAGSAGSFGYRRLGEKAKELEEALVLLSQTSAQPNSLQKQQIITLIDNLQNLVLASSDEAGEMPFVDKSTDTNAMTMATNRRIVLIEDDTLLAQDMATQLGMFGWEVSVCANTVDAASFMKEPWPAALVLDLTLPEGPLAGLDFVKQIQSQGNLPMPHIVISARSDWEARLTSVRSGASAYLIKPVDISTLVEQLERLTSRDLPAPFRVLLVDDDEMLANHYVQILAASGMDAIAITSPSRLLEAMGEHHPEIVLLDLHMPECSGIEALKVIRQDPQFDSLPVVFMSTESGLALQQNAMRIGAEDFLQKPIADANLILALTVRVERFRALTALIRQDSMTGLLNHISFKLRLEAEVDRSRRSNETLSLVLLDIDHFKKVNDTYGHPQGDRVIKSLAQLLRKRLRKSDIIGRYGGEEFVIAMPNTLPSQAVKILDELRKSFGKLRFETPQGEFACAFSGGVAATPPAESAISLINSADDALYRAKRAGRNRIEAFI